MSIIGNPTETKTGYLLNAMYSVTATAVQTLLDSTHKFSCIKYNGFDLRGLSKQAHKRNGYSSTVFGMINFLSVWNYLILREF
jgi:hypothetical protein